MFPDLVCATFLLSCRMVAPAGLMRPTVAEEEEKPPETLLRWALGDNINCTVMRVKWWENGPTVKKNGIVDLRFLPFFKLCIQKCRELTQKHSFIDCCDCSSVGSKLGNIVFVFLSQLYELDNDPKRKEFLDDLFTFMQKRGLRIFLATHFYPPTLNLMTQNLFLFIFFFSQTFHKGYHCVIL